MNKSNMQRLLVDISKCHQPSFDMESFQQFIAQSQQIIDSQQRVDLIDELKAAIDRNPDRDDVNDLLSQSIISLTEECKCHSFIAYQNIMNKQDIGITIMDYKGNFILCDLKSRLILELNHKKLKRINLFGLMSELSLKKVKDFVLIKPGQLYGELIFTIYSERSKKKCFKLVKSIKKNKQRKSFLKAKEQRVKARKVDILYTRYLRTIKIKFSRIQAEFTKGFVEQIKEQDDFQMHQVTLNQKIQAVVCEVQEIDQQENFTLQELLEDHFIVKSEAKFQKKVEDNHDKKKKVIIEDQAEIDDSE
ncbi:hypothetical protein pb186bvf_015106 [Paramecium bursaria]